MKQQPKPKPTRRRARQSPGGGSAARPTHRGRVAHGEAGEHPRLTQPDARAAEVLRHHAPAAGESYGALYLDSRQRLLASQALPAGPTLDATFDTTRLLRQALLAGASSILLFHAMAHPMLPTPLQRLLAIRLGESARVVGLRLLDFLVVTADGRWASALHSSTGQVAMGAPVSKRHVAGHVGP